MITMTNTATCRWLFSPYAKYNNGSLSGAWLDLSDYSDKEEFYRALLDFAGYMDGREIPDSRMEKVMVVLGVPPSRSPCSAFIFMTARTLRLVSLA